MYVVPPPRDSDLNNSDGSAGLRTYQAWKGSNVFLLQKRLIFGPDIRSVFLTIFLIATLVAIFCGFFGRKLMDKYSDSFGIWVIVVSVVFTIYMSPALLLSNPVPSQKHFIISYCIIVSVVALTCLWIYIVYSK